MTGTRPLVGITCAYDHNQNRAFLPSFYDRAVQAVGGLPVLLPPGGAELAAAYRDRLDGLILAGGDDVDPAYFGEEPLPGCGSITPERDALEMALVQAFRAAGKPVLGICRGLQVMNIALGGDIYQDLSSQFPGALKHEQAAPRWHGSHRVRITPGSRLAALHGGEELRVNSFHHQAVRRVAAGLVVTAVAADGVVEALEDPQARFFMGVQWHPEGMWERDPLHLALFQGLVAACRSA